MIFDNVIVRLTYHHIGTGGEAERSCRVWTGGVATRSDPVWCGHQCRRRGMAL